MWNEYILVITEIVWACVCALMCYFFSQRTRGSSLTFHDLKVKMIWFLMLLCFLILYIIEYHKGSSYLEIAIWFVSSLLICFIFFMIELVIFNIIFGLFHKKHASKNIFKSLIEHFYSLRIEVVYDIYHVIDTCFVYTCLLSLGSMLIAFMTDYLIAYYHLNSDIYLLKIGPLLILMFVIIAGSLWMLSVFIMMIQLKVLSHYDMNREDYTKQKQRLKLKEKINNDKYLW